MCRSISYLCAFMATSCLALAALAISPGVSFADDPPSEGLFCEANCSQNYCNNFPCWCATPGWQCRNKMDPRPTANVGSESGTGFLDLVQKPTEKS